MIEASAASDLGFWIDAIGRLVVATAAGMVLGWERSRENRQIMGLRTLGLVGLASCIAVQAIVHSGLPNVNADAAGRAGGRKRGYESRVPPTTTRPRQKIAGDGSSVSALNLTLSALASGLSPAVLPPTLAKEGSSTGECGPVASGGMRRANLNIETGDTDRALGSGFSMHCGSCVGRVACAERFGSVRTGRHRRHLHSKQRRATTAQF